MVQQNDEDKKFTIGEALKTGRLIEARILAGKKGLDRIINSVTVMDIPEIVNWLTGRELVIAGVLFEQCFSRELVDSLLTKQVAGIVTKEKFTSKVSPQMIEYCDNIKLPIILAPPDCNWGEIMNPIINEIVKKPYLIIEEGQKFHNTLMQALINNVSLSMICKNMYENNKLNIAFMDNDFHLIGFHDTEEFNWEIQTHNVEKKLIQDSGLSFQSLDKKDEAIYSYTNEALLYLQKKLLLYPVRMNQVKYGHIATLVEGNILQQLKSDVIKIQQLGLFFALHATKQNEINNATRRFNGLLFDQLLTSKGIDFDGAEALLAPMRKKIHHNYIAVQFLYENLSNIGCFVGKHTKISRFQIELKQRFSIFDHLLIFEKSNALILLFPYPTIDFETTLKQIRNIFIKTTEPKCLHIGISEPTSIGEINTAFIQSTHAANYLSSTEAERPYFYYKDLGILKLLFDNEGNINKEFLKETYEKYILPLKAHDKKYNSSLINTLETYLKNNCSKTKTEKQLYMHKNTLRARIATINKVIDCNIDSVEDRFNIQLAMKINSLFEGESEASGYGTSSTP